MSHKYSKKVHLGKQFLVALGANLPSGLGDPTEALVTALQEISDQGLRITAVSRFWKTPAFPKGSGPDFANAAAVLRSDLSPEQLLDKLHRIETAIGRTRDVRWGPRIIDLDLIACENVVLPDIDIYSHWRKLPLNAQTSAAPDQLILPHPRMQDRAFVLAPLADICPDWRHPVLRRTVSEMLYDLPPEMLSEISPI